MSTGQMTSYLQRLGFRVDNAAGNGDEMLSVQVPSWRPDVEQEVCLIEEIVRLHGYNEIPSERPRVAAPGHRPMAAERVRDEIRRLLVGQGFLETVNTSWMSPRILEIMGTPEDHVHRQAVEIANPMGEDTRRMRTNLLCSLLEVMLRNAGRSGPSALRLFEIGRVYLSDQLPPEDLLDEDERLGIVMTGPSRPRFWGDSDQQWVDFFHLKGVIENLLEVLHVRDWVVEPCVEYYLHPGRAARLVAGGEPIGIFGELDPELCTRMEMQGRVCMAELDVATLVEREDPAPDVQPLPAYPAAVRDIAVVLGENETHGDIRAVIEEAAGDLLEEVELFDVYRGDPVPSGSKSVAYRLTYRAPERTLTDAEVDERHGRVRDALARAFAAELRS